MRNWPPTIRPWRYTAGVVNTTVDYSSQQSHSIDIHNSWQHLRFDDGRALLTTAVVWRQVEQETLLIFKHKKKIKTRTYYRVGVWGWCEWGNRISDANFLIVFYSNYRSIVLSFRDMTTGRRITDGRTMDGGLTLTGVAYLARKTGR